LPDGSAWLGTNSRFAKQKLKIEAVGTSSEPTNDRDRKTIHRRKIQAAGTTDRPAKPAAKPKPPRFDFGDESIATGPAALLNGSACMMIFIGNFQLSGQLSLICLP